MQTGTVAVASAMACEGDARDAQARATNSASQPVSDSKKLASAANEAPRPSNAIAPRAAAGPPRPGPARSAPDTASSSKSKLDRAGAAAAAATTGTSSAAGAAEPPRSPKGAAGEAGLGGEKIVVHVLPPQLQRKGAWIIHRPSAGSGRCREVKQVRSLPPSPSHPHPSPSFFLLSHHLPSSAFEQVIFNSAGFSTCNVINEDQPACPKCNKPFSRAPPTRTAHTRGALR